MTAPQLAPGQSIAGKLTVRTLLGYGGATATYAATNAQGREVVVRMLSPQLGQRGDVLGALQQTSVFTGSLPDATATILESGFDPQTGAPYTVTEQVTTQSLAQAAQAGPLAVAEVVSIVQGIARAVDAAHGQRIAHGGLKPQNVFVGPGPKRAVKVADFGMAAVRAALPTAEGSAIASPWMAPEQLQGAAAGPASDVFSAGLITFFAATGKPYWRSCQGAQPDLAALQQEMSAPRVPASVRARDLGASLSQGFDAILARALAQNPAERYASVGELADAVLKGGGPNKMAMTMPLNAMPLAAQEMLRNATAAQAPAPSAQAPMAGGDTLAIQSPLDAPSWSSQQGSRQSAQPPTQAIPQMQTQPAMQPQMPQMPQTQYFEQRPAIPQGPPPPAPQPGPGMPVLTPLGGFQPPVNQGPPPGGPGMGPPMGPGLGMQPGVHAQPSYGPPPESSVVVPKSKTGLIIALVLILIALAGGGVVLFLVLGKPKEVVVPDTTASTSSAPAAQPTTSGASSAPPAATTAPAAATAPPSSATAAATEAPAVPEAGAPAAATPDASAATPEQAVMTIVCTPECETIKVDDKPLTNDSDASLFPSSEPVELAPGPHTIAVARASFLPQSKRVTVKAGQKDKVAFFLAKPGAAPVPQKTCGKFLERCP